MLQIGRQAAKALRYKRLNFRLRHLSLAHSGFQHAQLAATVTELETMVAALRTAFNGFDPNGVWSLYVVDDTALNNGAIVSGWTLSLTTVTPAFDLAVTSSSSPEPVAVGAPPDEAAADGEAPHDGRRRAEPGRLASAFRHLPARNNALPSPR